MTKEDLIRILEKGGDVKTRVAAERVLELICNSIRAALIDGDKVQITRFGTWRTRKIAARNGINPRTGEAIHIPARTKVAFKAGSDLQNL